ncbi:MAG: pyridoxal phosphate-dependent aminotransferase [Melioribacteraceae bacterium]|nr:pyridoxal phosphate-dependent aminotransferase [Melioribacteraceae bacterium]MCF8263825.1 pyridoxal phosphate-dependent aminotransferase [Melioribacteraceae bacterium]MCF8412506.1 pyridoxal phosphate-dependent aminotransferase [Melioribacteraceae bacterium]
MPVSERITKVTASQTMKVAAKAKELRAQGENVIDLSVGEPDFPTPQNIKDAAIKAINDNQTRYTINSGTIELRQAIKEKLKNENNLDYDLSEISVNSGAKQSVYNALQAVVNAGDEVIIPAPYWVSYPEMVTLADGVSVVIDTSLETSFKITPQQLREAVTEKTKAFIFCNPSNPTGAGYTVDEMKEILKVSREFNFYIIVDEIYEKLVYGDYKFVSFASLDLSLKDRIIVINGVSKAYSMTGWRIGYTAGPADVIQGMNKVQSHSTSNASSVSQAAAVEALVGPQDEVEVMRLQFEKRRNYFAEELNKIDGIKCNLPEGAFYIFPDVSGLFGKSVGERKIESSLDIAMYLLDEVRIAAVPGSAFGAEGYMRFSYATSMESLEDAVQRIKSAVSKLN